MQAIESAGASSPSEDSMILLQISIVSKLIKRFFPEKVVTADFKREFTKSLSLFILYLQNSIDKKKFGREDILAALEREGFARVAQDLRNNKETVVPGNNKKELQIELPQPDRIMAQ